MKDLNPNFIVGIGGSAGGLNAFKSLLDGLPPNTGMAFVVVSHIQPTAHSQLRTILSRHTKMPVVLAAHAMPIRSNFVYVIPSDADLLVETLLFKTFKIVSPRTQRAAQIDLLFN